MGLIGWLALRGLVTQRLSLVVLVLAVAIGVGFQIPNVANLAGSSTTLLDEELAWGLGDVRVEPRRRPRFAITEEVAAQVRAAVPGARVVPVLVLPGGIAASGSRFLGAAVLGVDFETTPVRFAAGAAPVAGELGVVLGAALARRLSVTVGDPVELRVLLEETGLGLQEGGAYTVTVRGIAGNSAAYQSVFVARAFLAQELAEPDAASMLVVHLAEHDAAPVAAKAIDAAVPDVRAVDWKTDDPLLPMIVRANGVIERVSYGMVIAAISVPLLALLYLRARRQRRELAVLRAVGFTRRDVFVMHALQSLAIGGIGAALGAVIGAAAVTVFDRYPVFTWETMVVRPRWSAATFGVPVVVAIATSALAGLIAAWYAARADPARVLQELD